MANMHTRVHKNSEKQKVNLLFSIAQSQNKSVLKLLAELIEEEIKDIELFRFAGERYKEKRIRHEDTFWD